MIFRAQIGFPFDSALPRDVITINPHYDGTSEQALADALKANLIANTMVGATKPFTVKIYNAQKAPPNYPIATASQAGTTPVSTGPRELAIALSYYGGVNRPRYRGRVFIPYSLTAGATGLRPSGAQMTAVLGWANTLGKNLPASTAWCVYSRINNSFNWVSNAWVDDEWDIQRSRGLRGTTRQLGTIP